MKEGKKECEERKDGMRRNLHGHANAVLWADLEA